MQLALPFGPIEQEDQAAKAAITARLDALEAAAKNCRIAWDETTGRVMRALGKLCGSRLQQSRGVVGLRWVGKTEELANDRDVERSKKTVAASLLRLERLGIIAKENHLDWRGKPDGLVISLEMTRVNQLARIGSISQKDVREDVREDVLKDVPEYLPKDVLKDVPRLEETLYTELPSIPNNPPPTESATATRLRCHERRSSEVAEVKDRSAADFGNCLEPLRELRNAFASIGIERYHALANEFATRVPEALEAVETYRLQKSKFKKPGAVISFLRDGAWPASGVKSLAELEQLKQKQQARDREATLERQRIAQARQSSEGFTAEELNLLRTAGLAVLA